MAPLSIYGHLRHAHGPASYLTRASWSPPSSSNRASRAAPVQLPPPLLTHRLRNPPTSSSSVITLISTIGCDHTGGENRRRASSAGYLESYNKRIHLFIFPFFFSSSLDPRLCVSIREHQLDLFSVIIWISARKCRTDSNCYDRETSGEAPSYHEQFNKHDP